MFEEMCFLGSGEEGRGGCGRVGVSTGDVAEQLNFVLTTLIY